MDKIKLIIFDWDDVFTKGSTLGYQKCYHKALADVGVNLSHQEELKRMRPRWGARHEIILEDLLHDRSDLLPKAIQTYEKHLMDGTFENEVEVIAEARDILERLSQKYMLAVISGIHPELLLKRIMPNNNIPNLFKQIITAYELEDPLQSKPHPISANKIINNLGVSKDETVVVGDSKNDVQLGKNAGTKTVAVLTGHLNRAEAELLKPDYILDSVKELEGILS